MTILVENMMIGLIPVLLGLWTIFTVTVFREHSVAICRWLLTGNRSSVYRSVLDWKLRLLESPGQRMLCVCGGIAAIVLGILVAVFLPS